MGTRVLRRPVFTFILILLASTAAQALVINPSYVDAAGESWTPTRQGVIEQAIADWESLIGDEQTVNVTLTFENAGTGGYLGLWSASSDPMSYGTDVYPWTPEVHHTITFNADLLTGYNYIWWDSSPQTDDDIPFHGWDALTTARHEMAHMMGFTESFYVDDLGQTNVDRWLAHVSGTTFDPGGLDVSLAGSNDLSHVLDDGATADDLMTAYQYNSERQDISMTDLLMLELAHGYTIIPEPASLCLFALVGVVLVRSRRVRARRD